MYTSVKDILFLIILLGISDAVFGYGYNITIYDYDRNGDKICKCKTTDGLEGTCMPYASCFYEFGDLALMADNVCDRERGVTGVCCPLRGLSTKYKLKKIAYRPPRRYRKPPINVIIDRKLLNQAISDGKRSFSRQLSNEQRLIKAGFVQQNNTMESFHQGFFGAHDTLRRDINRNGCLILETSRSLVKKLGLSPEKCHDFLHEYDLDETSLTDRCVKPPKCDHKYKYRSIDGSCNNLKHPLWGRAMSQLSRLVPPHFDDGIDAFRKSAVNRSDLPGARQLSANLTETGDVEHQKLSVLFLQFAQFLDHDMSLGLNTRADTGEGLSCCLVTENGQLVQHPACKPIPIPVDDFFYAKFNRTCLNFVRSVPATTSACKLGPREQAGAVTHFIDGSQIYGSNDDRMREVRSFIDGKLNVSIINGKEFLPFDTKRLSVFCGAPDGQQCVYAGDIRVNQQLGLTTLQLMFLREHNRIATELKRLNPRWVDETLFQESRRIMGAILQWITYNEFLPLAIGRRSMYIFNLFPSTWGFTGHYKDYSNPGIINEFATAAFRWHSLIQSFYHLVNSEGEYTSHPQLRDIFNDPTPLYKPGVVDEVLYGTVVQPSQKFDGIVTEEIKHQLFRAPKAKFGGDLIATNIQRGRDHGLPPYNKVREVCGLGRIKSFDDLNRAFGPGIGSQFARLYKSVDDIDLFLGGIHERTASEGILGPVFACIVAEQFKRTKEGDRFWFENIGLSHSFTEGQIYEIRKVSLSGIICANGDDIQFFPPLALMQPIFGNRLKDCSEISQMNLNHWKNEKV